VDGAIALYSNPLKGGGGKGGGNGGGKGNGKGPKKLSAGNVDWYLTGVTYVDLDLVSTIPEPSTFTLAALGLIGLLACGRRRRG